jgi:hypothetical protein
MVSYNQNLGVWQVNGRGAYASQDEASAAESGGGAPAPQAPQLDPKQFTGAPPAGPAAPMDRAPVRTAPAAQPYVAGYAGGGRTASGGATGNTDAAAAAHAAGNIGGAGGAYQTSGAKTQAAFDAIHAKNQGSDPFNPFSALRSVLALPTAPIGYVAQKFNAGQDNRGAVAPASAPAAGVGTPDSRGLPASPAEAGVAPPQQVSQDPGAGVPSSVGAAPPMATLDRTQYDAAAAGLTQARSDFYDQLTRLSGVDPFGNQAFLQKATDRAVSQAAGTAAGARGGAAAMAGAQRQASGIQSQLAARGTQEVAEQGRRDAVQAAGMRIETVKGIGDVSQQLATNEVALADQATKVGEQNLRAYLGGRELDQAEKESLRRLATTVAQIDQQRYQTDVGYRQSVNQNLTAMYQSDNALKGVKMQVDASENLSPDEWLMGLVGAGTGLASGLVTSDRRQKRAFRAAKTSELKEYLTAAPGSHYRYRNPKAPGQRDGDNFGPMAQDLAKTKIGRTVVVEKADGLYVDSARLALADHAALTHLAQRVERLAARLSRKAK